MAIAADWQPVTLPIQGRDILSADLAPAGPKIGVMLKQAEEYWLDHGFAPDKKDLIAFLASQSLAGEQETE